MGKAHVMYAWKVIVSQMTQVSPCCQPSLAISLAGLSTSAQVMDGMNGKWEYCQVCYYLTCFREQIAERYGGRSVGQYTSLHHLALQQGLQLVQVLFLREQQESPWNMKAAFPPPRATLCWQLLMEILPALCTSCPCSYYQQELMPPCMDRITGS